MAELLFFAFTALHGIYHLYPMKFMACSINFLPVLLHGWLGVLGLQLAHNASPIALVELLMEYLIVCLDGHKKV